MISSLLHLVGLRPRVYYTLTNFRGGGGQGPLGPPLNTPMIIIQVISCYLTLYRSSVAILHYTGHQLLFYIIQVISCYLTLYRSSVVILHYTGHQLLSYIIQVISRYLTLYRSSVVTLHYTGHPLLSYII